MNDFFNPQLSNLQTQIQQIQSLMGKTPAPVAPPPPRSIESVNGEAGAREFLSNMGPNSSAAVFDKSESVFFLLSKDSNGTAAPLKRCPYTIEDVPEPGSNNITRQDFEDFKQEIRDVVSALVPKKTRAKEATDE